MSAPLTYSECMARLAACPALPRGERVARWSEGHGPMHTSWHWWRMATDVCEVLGPQWRVKAAPLRRAREERRKWKLRARGVADEFGVEKEEHADTRLELEWHQDELEERNIGAALLGFFTDLAILVRKTPAPCPWCGGTNLISSWLNWVYCYWCSSECPTRDDDDDESAIHAWNRIAVPQAFARLKDGE